MRSIHPTLVRTQHLIQQQMKLKTYRALIIASLFFSCQEKTADKDATATEKPMMMMDAFETIRLQKSNPTVPLQLAGELAPDQQTELFAKVNSYVKRIHVDIGSQVKAGQVLVVLEAPEIQAQVANAKAKWRAQEAIYTATKATYDRLYKANETKGAIAQDALDQITAKKLADEAQMKAAYSVYTEIKDIDNYLVIRAPFSGVITDRQIDLGAYVGPMAKAPLLVVQNTHKLRLSLSIPEAHTPYLNLGDTIRFKVRSAPEKTYFARISRKSGTLDLKLRSEKIEADYSNTGNVLKPFMVAETTIQLQNSQPTFFVPKTAVVDSNLGLYVIRVRDGKTENIQVVKGRALGDQFELFGALTEGDALLMKANEEILEGTAVPPAKMKK